MMTVFASLHRRITSGDEAAARQLLEAVRSPASCRPQIPKGTMVNTRSNLRFEVLSEILDSVGIDSSEFETRTQLIDRSLCDARNEIAHGREQFPSPESFSELHNQIMGLMETIRDRVLEAARTGAYNSNSIR